MTADPHSRLVQLLRSTLALIEYYDGVPEPTAELKAALKRRLEDTVVELDVISAAAREILPTEAHQLN